MTTHIVMLEAGEYSDYSAVPVFASASLVDAEAFARSATVELEALYESFRVALEDMDREAMDRIDRQGRELLYGNRQASEEWGHWLGDEFSFVYYNKASLRFAVLSLTT